jgi:hypothetical protein
MNVLEVTQQIRTLRGQNGALLVRADDGRYFIQKFYREAGNSHLLFNEAFASQLGNALGLPFPEWSILTPAHAQLRKPRLAVHRTSFGSELVNDAVEYLPKRWFSNIENRADAYKCLLFDLWCNHSDSRQVVFRSIAPRTLRAYFIDHDQLFSELQGQSLPGRIARSRYLDLRIYEEYSASLRRDLERLAIQMKALAYSDIRQLLRAVPNYWGSAEYREQVVSGLERRVDEIGTYVVAILDFANTTANKHGDPQ